MVQKNSLILGLLGPTAVGKTELSLILAERLGTDIISADSMQIFRGFDIGTAKPSVEERRGIVHHMIDIADPCEYFSSRDYADMCDKTIETLSQNGKIPFVTGGTGFYFDSLFKELDFENSVDDNVRRELNEIYEKEGAERIYAILKEEDPVSAAEIHPNNVKRVIRAIEIFRTTGTKKSEGSGENRKERYPNVIFELCREREVLYSRIEKRIDIMLENGLIDEVARLMETVPISAQSMQGIGYKEFVPYINGEISKEQATENLILNTRHYAKRQLSYFKRMNTVKLDATRNPIDLADEILRIYEEKKASL